MKIIAYLENDYNTKFGVPRQSNPEGSLLSRVVFVPEYGVGEALRGLEGFSHIWLIWRFSECQSRKWSPTVRPPRLGGNTRMGVFATRSPNRPNPIGLSCVKLEGIEKTESGYVLYVRGADLINKTPIYDIKPYLPFTVSHPEATAGFAGDVKDYCLEVNLPRELALLLPQEKLQPLKEALSEDPRPSYHNDPKRLYGIDFGGYEVKFTVEGKTLTVKYIAKTKKGKRD